MRFGKPRALAGVDIGSSSIKVVQLKRGRQDCQLAWFALSALPPDAVADGAIADAAMVAEKLTALFAAHPGGSPEVATAVSGQSVIVKRISLPLMSAEELYDRIPAEAGQHIPFDIADVNISYQLLETVDGHMDVLLVAVKKDKIESHLAPFIQAGKKARILDVDAFALENCFEAGYQPVPREVVALLNIGASVMNIAIVRDGLPLFNRDVLAGGKQYTAALQKELQLGLEDAEMVKTGGSHPGVSAERRDAVLRSVSASLLLEIQKTFEFFRFTAGNENIARIYLSGGSARVPGLLVLLRDEFGVPVEELDPFQGLVLSPGQHDETQLRLLAPRLAVAVGLALRGVDAA